MIFYKAIKYTILDYCIEKLFNGIVTNFRNKENLIYVRDLKEGMKIREIHDSIMLLSFYDCKIVNVTKRDINLDTYLIGFTFKHSNSDIFESLLVKHDNPAMALELMGRDYVIV